MYSAIERIINHNWVQGDSMQQYILYTCSVCIILFSVVFIDLIYRIFSHFWRGGK